MKWILIIPIVLLCLCEYPSTENSRRIGVITDIEAKVGGFAKSNLYIIEIDSSQKILTSSVILPISTKMTLWCLVKSTTVYEVGYYWASYDN